MFFSTCKINYPDISEDLKNYVKGGFVNDITILPKQQAELNV